MKFPRYTREQKKSTKLSDGQIKNIRERRKEGDSYKSIAQEFSVSQSVVYWWCLPDKERIRRRRQYYETTRDAGKLEKHDPKKYKTYLKRKKVINPDVMEYKNESSLEYARNNKEKKSAYSKEYRKKNKARLDENNRRWQQENREYLAAKARERYRKKKQID